MRLKMMRNEWNEIGKNEAERCNTRWQELMGWGMGMGDGDGKQDHHGFMYSSAQLFVVALSKCSSRIMGWWGWWGVVVGGAGG